jgi:hypothetical protein
VALPACAPGVDEGWGRRKWDGMGWNLEPVRGYGLLDGMRWRNLGFLFQFECVGCLFQFEFMVCWFQFQFEFPLSAFVGYLFQFEFQFMLFFTVSESICSGLNSILKTRTSMFELSFLHFLVFWFKSVQLVTILLQTHFT